MLVIYSYRVLTVDHVYRYLLLKGLNFVGRISNYPASRPVPGVQIGERGGKWGVSKSVHRENGGGREQGGREPFPL